MSRHAISLLMLLGLSPILAGAQDQKAMPATPGERELTLTIMCDGRMLGRRAGCRVYEAADGTRSFVWSGTFVSDEEAKSAIKEWIQPLKVTRRDQAKDDNGTVVGERVVGSGRNPKTGDTAYVVIRRDIHNYWRIESNSLSDAMQLDRWIKASTLVEP